MLSTWTITHALFKATRQLIFMVLMWPLKTDSATGAPATGASPGSPTGSPIRHRRSSERARVEPGSFRPTRSFRPFLLFGVLRILCFLVVPAAFVAEWLGWYSLPEPEP